MMEVVGSVGWLGYDGGASTYVSFEQVNIVVQVLFVDWLATNMHIA